MSRCLDGWMDGWIDAGTVIYVGSMPKNPPGGISYPRSGCPKKGNTGISTLGCFPHEADLDNMDYFQFEEHVLGNTTKKESGASCAHGQKLSLCPCNVGEAKHEHLLSAAR